MFTRIAPLAASLLLYVPALAAAQTPPAAKETPAPKPAETYEMLPKGGDTGRTGPVLAKPGSYELRPEIGGGVAFANFGNPTVGSNHMVLGLTIAKNKTSALSFAWGFHYIFGDRVNGAHASWEARYRFYGLNPWVVPVAFGGLAAQFGTPEDARKKGDRATQIVGGFRGGLGLDFPISERIIPTFQAAFEVGPRFWPNAMMYGGAIFTFGLNFVL